MPPDQETALVPLLRLDGNIVLMGDPVAIWDWTKLGTYFTLRHGDIHGGPGAAIVRLPFKPLTGTNYQVARSNFGC